MGASRKLKRNALKGAYRKFTKKWRDVKAQQITELELKAFEKRQTLIDAYIVKNGVSYEEANDAIPAQTAEGQTLGRKPPFKNWLAIVANNMKQAQEATPQDVKEFAEEVPDLSWDEQKEDKKP